VPGTVSITERGNEPLAARRHIDVTNSREGERRQLLGKLQRANPQTYRLLVDSPSVEKARKSLYSYLNTHETELYMQNGTLHPLEHAIARQCIQVLKSILAPRNESKVDFSTLGHLWRIVHGAVPKGRKVNAGFLLEFVHLFRGIQGSSGIAQGWLGPILAEEGLEVVDFGKLKGRPAGAARSDFLDQVGKRMWALVRRYPTGLDPALITERERNRQQILDFFDATAYHWDNYAWQLAHLFSGPESLPRLERLIPMTEEEKEAIRLCVEHSIPFGITPYYLSLFDFDSADRRKDARAGDPPHALCRTNDRTPRRPGTLL
jgi:lysine 2,3-aminomutase